MLWESVTRDVRFLQQGQPGNSAARKLMPPRIAHRMQIHLLHQSIEQCPQRWRIRQRRRIASVRFNNPLTT